MMKSNDFNSTVIFAYILASGFSFGQVHAGNLSIGVMIGIVFLFGSLPFKAYSHDLGEEKQLYLTSDTSRYNKTLARMAASNFFAFALLLGSVASTAMGTTSHAEPEWILLPVGVILALATTFLISTLGSFARNDP